MTNTGGNRQTGFTLIELVMVIAIIGIIAVFAIGRLDLTSTFSERGAYDKLKAGLEYARKAAVAKRRYVQASIAGNQVSFLYDSNNAENASRSFAATNYLVLPASDKNCSGGNGNTVCAPGGVTITASAASFTFNPEGVASTTVTIAVTGAPTATCGNGTTVSGICIEGGTGYVQ